MLLSSLALVVADVVVNKHGRAIEGMVWQLHIELRPGVAPRVVSKRNSQVNVSHKKKLNKEIT